MHLLEEEEIDVLEGTRKLYDLEKDGVPIPPKSSVRTKQVFVCLICGGKTNRVIGCCSGKVKAVCPNFGEYWHHRLELEIKTLVRARQTEDRISDERVFDLFREEIATLQAECEGLVTHDIEGKPKGGTEHFINDPCGKQNDCSYQQ